MNAGIAYSFNVYGLNVFWLAPMWFLNGFFFWAERDIYVRERRNYDDWYEEMRSIFEDEERFSWDKSLMAVQQKRRRRRWPATNWLNLTARWGFLLIF